MNGRTYDGMLMLPAKPLADAITRLMWQHAVSGTNLNAEWSGIKEARSAAPVNPLKGVIQPVCERVGVNVRMYTAWRDGQHKNVRFDVVDRVLARTGWNWFDVYDDCPDAELAFTGEVAQVAA